MRSLSSKTRGATWKIFLNRESPTALKRILLFPVCWLCVYKQKIREHLILCRTGDEKAWHWYSPVPCNKMSVWKSLILNFLGSVVLFLKSFKAGKIPKKKKIKGRRNRWQKYTDVCNMITVWLDLYWRKRKKSRLIKRYYLSLVMFPVLGVAGNMSKCFQRCFASFSRWCLQRLCIYEFSFSVAAGVSDSGSAPSCRDPECGGLLSPARVRGNHEHLPSHPLLRIITSQEGDWLSCCFSSQRRPKAQRE